MVRVFKCHSFASQCVIPISKEPLMICADGDKVFVATNDCEIIIFKITDGTSFETQRCPTISQVEHIVYNSNKNYIATIELKKSWKRMTKSVRVYLNWETNTPDSTQPRTKVRIAGKSHVQHISTSSRMDVMEIVEVPLEDNATCVAVCKYTGNFAVACGSEVKLCSVVEKTVANSDKTYLDVEVFLELCWKFQVLSISLCEEFIFCCSQKEVQGIRIRYDEGEKKQQKRFPVSPPHSTGQQYFSDSNQDVPKISKQPPETDYHHSYQSESFLDLDQSEKDRVATVSSPSELNESELKSFYKKNSNTFTSWRTQPSHQSSQSSNLDSPETSGTNIVKDENFVEWNFQQGGGAAGGASVCLPGLHTSLTQSQCYHHAHVISPPVLSEFSGGKVKSLSGIQAETILYLSDPQEKEEWKCVLLIPTYSPALTAPMRISSKSTDRMRSVPRALRTSMCCYVSGTRGGYLYQISPLLTQVSSYKYTDRALQVGVSQNYLHVVTRTGIETYTSRWGVVSLEMQEQEEDGLNIEQTHPPSSLDICLCGHEPFFGAVNLSMGSDFLALLSKVEDPPSSEVHWSLYVLGTFSVVDLYKDMIAFAMKIKATGPASYIHLLQEAHLLLTSNPLFILGKDPEVKDSHRQVCRMLAEYFSLPGQEDWSLCWPYYKSSGTSVEDIVNDAMKQAEQKTPLEFGKGLIDCLNHILFTHDGHINVKPDTCDSILKIYATSAAEKLSQVILLSNLKLFTTEAAFHHLNSWLDKKSRASQPLSTVDKLAMVHLHLASCDVDEACSELISINKACLINVCASHPALIYDNLSSFTPLSQLMRQHMSATLLEVLVEMLDRSVMSFDSLLSLLKCQTDLSNNNHVREVLELILSDEKRAFLFDEAAQMLCEIYIAKLKERPQPSPRQMTPQGHQKLSLPQGNGHFAQRFAWLDYIPPFQGPNKMARPCQRLEVKQIPGQGSRNASLPVTMVMRPVNKERCQCFVCNENLLKLQSLLSSSRLTPELASFVIQQIEDFPSDTQDKVKADNEEFWDSLRLQCLILLDWKNAISQVVDRYPSISAMFAAGCFAEHLDKYSYLLRSLETVIRESDVSKPALGEEIYVKAYKDLLSTMAELFSPATFLEMLPADGSLYFLLPYLCTSLRLNQTDKLKQKIVDMGNNLLSN